MTTMMRRIQRCRWCCERRSDGAPASENLIGGQYFRWPRSPATGGKKGQGLQLLFHRWLLFLTEQCVR
ncbi:hypothetical protein TorRG33x02_062340 [Trema orientale]|uniref:Uncharacterized protein n=1 Tax=Trema orientale TaxID=63057 RepID=A0A2P5FJF8_TREOI|nr:hypothetical protein TorRG33x02_062340 [Trema orientale]